MLVYAIWAFVAWLRLERYHAAQVNATWREETAIQGIPAPRTAEGGPAYDRSAYVEQSTCNREHDDRVRRLKVAALHEFKRDFVRRPVLRT